MKTKIVDPIQVQKIIRRMAYQVYEKNFDAKELVFAAISGQGKEVASQLAKELIEISGVKVQHLEINIDKGKPQLEDIVLDKSEKLAGKRVVLVDDVLNTGRTLIYAMVPFLAAKVKSIQVAVLVDRNHHSFPVNDDYKGISLQTTLQEHVTVVMEKRKISVYLE
jgi:pyrimidine operon attenuation protein/uracil phosphoribosyltransferase